MTTENCILNYETLIETPEKAIAETSEFSNAMEAELIKKSIKEHCDIISVTGEMFLGYKTNIKQKQLDLEDDCERTFARLVNEGKLEKKSSRQFKISEEWER